MKQREGDSSTPSTVRSRVWLLLRGAVPLLALALALLAGPMLLVWWLSGGPFSARDLLIGGGISLALLAGMGLALGWAVGRLGRGPRR